jgi:hypothetical protein
MKSDGSSGPALLLELARVMAARPSPYTMWFMFLDAEEPLMPELPLDQTLLGSRALTQLLAHENLLSRMRAGVVFDRVAGADLRIARDLRSHRVYREIFWSAAAKRGRGDVFPAQAPFETPHASHLIFAAAGMQRVVAIVGSTSQSSTEHGNSPAPASTASEPASLESVGVVAETALQEITKLLRRVDRYAPRPAASPPAAGGTSDAPPAPQEAEPAAGTPESG